MADSGGSYTDGVGGPMGTLREFARLTKRTRKFADHHAGLVVDDIREVLAQTKDRLGMDISDLRLLDLGCGQMYKHVRCFAVNNDVVGLDYDVVPVGFAPASYFKLLTTNGPRRFIKTLGRKLLGVDAALTKAIERRLDGHQRKFKIVQGDAAKLPFGENEFDFVYAADTFEHLPKPRESAAEIARVLKPGGGCYIKTHLYTSDAGHHDLRVAKHTDTDVPLWGHLRPDHEESINPQAWTNKVPLAEWHSIFSDTMPGSLVEPIMDSRTDIGARLAELRSKGELAQYTDDDLLTVDVLTFWRKPE